MNQFYAGLGLTRQGFHQRYDRLLAREELKAQLIPLISKIRKQHPMMSSREMYRLVQPEELGRDAFERLAFENGFKIEPRKRFHVTTNSLGITRFPNLITDRELTGVNQVWVSDITYYRLEERFYYITLIMDLHSRRVLSSQLSKSLRTEQTTIPALKKALRLGRMSGPASLIMHSDGGGQYYCKEFIELTQSHGIRNSMAANVYENANMERMMGTVKNYYLIPYGPASFGQLQGCLVRAVKMYNEGKPHSSLNHLTPCQFEKKENIEDMLITPNHIHGPVTNIPTI